MPIFLDDINSRDLSTPALIALLEIGMAIGEQGVTPTLAASEIQLKLRNLVPPDHQGLLRIDGHRTWNKIHEVYLRLAFAFGEHRIDCLADAASVVQCIYAHSTRPPRELAFPDTVEVGSFNRMAGYVELDCQMRYATIDGRKTDLLKFCKYCWRPVTYTKSCLLHSVENHGTSAASAEYKRAQRLRQAFEGQVLQLATQEEIAFHNSDFQLPVFFPDENLENWLSLRRPRLLRAISAAGVSSVTLAAVCGYLYDSEAVALDIATQPQALTPVTLRAEAWLTAMEDRPRHGGHRTTKSMKTAQ